MSDLPLSLIALSNSLATAVQELHTRSLGCNHARPAALALIQACPSRPLLDLALTHTQSLLEGQAGAPETLDLLEDCLCESADLNVDTQGMPYGHLAVAPLLMLSDCSFIHTPLDESALQAAVKSLQAEGLIEIDASLGATVTALPVLLDVDECAAWSHADVLHLRKLLAEGATDRAIQHVNTLRTTLFEPSLAVPALLAAQSDTSYQVGLFVFYVESFVADPFALRDRPVFDADAAEDSLDSVLNSASSALSTALGFAVDLVDTADWWYSGTEAAENINRQINAQAEVQALRAHHELKPSDTLVALEPAELPNEQPGFVVTLRTSLSSADAGEVHWPSLRAESADKTLESLYDFLTDAGILPNELVTQALEEAPGQTFH